MERNRLICGYDRHGKLLKAFPDIATAASVTGIHKNIISRNLKGIMYDAPGGYYFRYEVLASDLRQKKETKIKWIEEE